MQKHSAGSTLRNIRGMRARATQNATWLFTHVEKEQVSCATNGPPSDEHSVCFPQSSSFSLAFGFLSALLLFLNTFVLPHCSQIHLARFLFSDKKRASTAHVLSAIFVFVSGTSAPSVPGFGPSPRECCPSFQSENVHKRAHTHILAQYTSPLDTHTQRVL